MRFAEVFLRLGSAFVGWMLLYTYFVWLAALHEMGCGPDGDEMHSVLLGLAPFTVVVALTIRTTRPIPEIHRLLSRLGIPLALLLPFALKNVWAVFSRSNLEQLAICSEDAPTSLHLAWAPVQLVAIILLALLVVQAWRETRIEKP